MTDKRTTPKSLATGATSSKRRMNMLATMLGGLVLFGAGAAQAQVKIPLVTFYNPGAGDYFTTSNPRWTCWYFNNCPEGTEPLGNYLIVGMQGHVYNPANPQPPNTNKLHLWFSETRGDNFLTSDPNWTGTVGTTQFGYVLVSIEGYLAQIGSMPLKSYQNVTEGDNAALATWRWSVPAGYTHYRTEGHLLPPDNASCAGAPVFPSSSFTARANYHDFWVPTPSGFIGGDRIKLTAPANWYTRDSWGHALPVRGYSWDLAGPGFPAPGRPRFALLARITAGRVFVNNSWVEAGVWFQALGGQEDFDGPCILFDYTGVWDGRIETVFNDDNIGDNGGGTTVTVKQWFR